MINEVNDFLDLRPASVVYTRGFNNFVIRMNVVVENNYRSFM